MARPNRKPPTDTNPEQEQDMSNEENTTEETPAAAEATEEKKSKTKKDPVPDGWETPVAFAKRLSAKLGTDFRPQMVYGFIKNSKGFPNKQNSDGAWIVEIEPALTWFDEYVARKAQRAVDKAAKAAAKAEATTSTES